MFDSLDRVRSDVCILQCQNVLTRLRGCEVDVKDEEMTSMFRIRRYDNSTDLDVKGDMRGRGLFLSKEGR